MDALNFYKTSVVKYKFICMHTCDIVAFFSYNLFKYVELPNLFLIKDHFYIILGSRDH